MLCDCGVVCFTYTNSSIGIRVWKCAVMKEKWVKDIDSKEHIFVSTNLEPCTFKHQETSKGLTSAFENLSITNNKAQRAKKIREINSRKIVCA